jgi:hypothetical protein
MNRGTGTGFLGLGFVLLIVGAVLRYAVTATATGFSINTAGVILLWAGVVAIILGVTFIAMGRPAASPGVLAFDDVHRVGWSRSRTRAARRC